jgi:hypothetical protein
MFIDYSMKKSPEMAHIPEAHRLIVLIHCFSRSERCDRHIGFAFCLLLCLTVPFGFAVGYSKAGFWAGEVTMSASTIAVLLAFMFGWKIVARHRVIRYLMTEECRLLLERLSRDYPAA